MKNKTVLMCGAAALTLASVPASAATIVLTDRGGVTGSASEFGFKAAADYWGAILKNNVTINLDVKFAPLPTNVIGSTGSRSVDYSVANWESRVRATKSNSSVDQNIVLPTLTNGGASFITNDVAADGNDDAEAFAVVLGDTVSSRTLFLNTAVIKAIGGNVATPGAADGSMTFSSNFAFDFNPSDGISANTFDFIGVAIHEMGHALGFVSGVDYLDYYGYPNGDGAGSLGYSLNDTSIFSALDMFRYSKDPHNLVRGNGAVLDLSVGTDSYFSIDGGKTALYGNSFATGSFNGDGDQASHWKDAEGVNRCGPQLGIMDPTFCFGQMGAVTGLDLAAFDAMGWNLSVDPLQSYNRTSAQIYLAAVPEPATWAMMIAGFGFIGGAMRDRRRKVSVTFA